MPKGWPMLAWKASVGYSRLSACSQRLVTQAGTCAALPVSHGLQMTAGGTCQGSAPPSTAKWPAINIQRAGCSGTAHQIAFVEEQQQVLVARVLAQVLLQLRAARAHRIPRINHLSGFQGAGGHQALPLKLLSNASQRIVHTAHHDPFHLVKHQHADSGIGTCKCTPNPGRCATTASPG